MAIARMRLDGWSNIGNLLVAEPDETDPQAAEFGGDQAQVRSL
jgi:hypothetical protein